MPRPSSTTTSASCSRFSCAKRRRCERRSMALARTRRDSGINYWPGFVDALSTLVLGVIFLLTVFVTVQFFLSQEVAGKDTALTRLNKLVATLTDELALEKSSKVSLEDDLTRMRASLAGAESERDRLKDAAQAAGAATGAVSAAQSRVNDLAGALDSQKQINARALAEVEVLTQQIEALRRQLGAVQAALDISRKNDQASQEKLADLGQRLNVALAQRVQELSRYRSDFFGRLRAILGNRPDIRIVGDRFVFQSEVFFDTGKSTLDKPEGRAELDALANALLELEKKIP